MLLRDPRPLFKGRQMNGKGISHGLKLAVLVLLITSSRYVITASRTAIMARAMRFVVRRKGTDG